MNDVFGLGYGQVIQDRHGPRHTGEKTHVMKGIIKSQPRADQDRDEDTHNEAMEVDRASFDHNGLVEVILRVCEYGFQLFGVGRSRTRKGGRKQSDRDQGREFAIHVCLSVNHGKTSGRYKADESSPIKRPWGLACTD